jgi:diaminopimelate decarboxylase
VVEAATRLRAELHGRISYATKANIHSLMLSTVDPVVDDFNVTNRAHMESVLASGVEPDRVVFVNPLVTPEVAQTALAAGVTRFAVDDVRGVDVLTAASTVPRSGALRLTLRLRPPPARSTGGAVVRFGNTASELRRVAAHAARAAAQIEALSFFVGTHADRGGAERPYTEALDELAKLQRDLIADGITVTTVNIGGGFPGARRIFHRDRPDFFATLRAAVAAVFPDDTTLICEPGRFLSEPAMTMVSRVVADRTVAGMRAVHVDASGYCGLFETTFIEPGGGGLPVVSERPGPPAPAHLLGPVMDSFDVIGHEAALPSLHADDLVAMPNTGAYSWGYASSAEGVRQPPVVEAPPDVQRCLTSIWTD